MGKPPGALARVERELERIGLLLQHDAALPSVTSIVAGEPIRGSWWGHPLGHVIYDLLHELAEQSGALDAKLVNGKITYVHPRLRPAFLALAQAPDAARRRGLSPLSRRLLARVTDGGPERLDRLARAGFAERKELTAAGRQLEARVLVHTTDVHTESGAHARQLQSWPAWIAERGERVPPRELAAARAELAEAADALAAGTTRRVKLAL